MNLQRGFFRLTLILSIIMGVVGIIYYATGGSLLSEGLNVLWWVGSVWVLYGFIRYVVIGFVIGGFKSREVGTNFLKKKTIPILISVAVLLLCAAFIQFLYKQKKVINFTPLPERQLDWGRIQKMYEAGGIYYEKKDMPDFLTDTEKAKEITAHSFRHSFATSWLQNNRNPVVLKKLMGWQSMNMLNVYEHLQVGKLQQEYNSFLKKR